MKLRSHYPLKTAWQDDLAQLFEICKSGLHAMLNEQALALCVPFMTLYASASHLRLLPNACLVKVTKL